MDAEQYFLIILLTRVLAHNGTESPPVIAQLIKYCAVVYLLWYSNGLWVNDGKEEMPK